MNNIDLSALPDPNLDSQFYTGVPFKRFLAWILDFTVVIFLFSVVVVLTLGIAAVLAFASLFLVYLAYSFFMLRRYSATLGMIVTGIELRNRHGEKLNPNEAIGHALGYLFMAIFVFLQIFSAIMMLFNKRGQGLHDLFFGIVAINRPVDH